MENMMRKRSAHNASLACAIVVAVSAIHWIGRFRDQ